MPIRFWDKDVDQHLRQPRSTSGVRPTFDPQDDPNDRYVPRRPRFRDADGHDYTRSEQAVNPFGEDIPGLLHPDELSTVERAHNPARTAAAAPGRTEPSSWVRSGAAAPLSQKQPGRANDRAA